MTHSESKRLPLLTWCRDFFFGNVMIYWLVSLIHTYSVIWQDGRDLEWQNKMVLSVIFALSYLGQMTFATLVPIFFIMILILIYPHRRVLIPFSIAIATLFTFSYLADDIVYTIFHFHSNHVYIALLQHYVYAFPLQLPVGELLSLPIIFFIFLLLEIMAAKHAARAVRWITKKYMQVHISVIQRELIQWSCLFCAVNILFFWLVGMKYLQALSWLYLDLNPIASTYIPALTAYFRISYFGQLAGFAFTLLLILLTMICVYPRRLLIFISAVIVASILACILVIDSIVYSLFHYHLNGIMLNLAIKAGTISFFALSLKEYLLAAVMGIGIVSAETILAVLMVRYLHLKFITACARFIIAVAGICLFSSYTMLVYSLDQPMGYMYAETARVLPFYLESVSTLLPVEYSRVALERSFELVIRERAQAVTSMRYPLAPLTFSKSQQPPYNIVMIIIDTWRPDLLTPEVMPNTYAFSQQSWQFKHHISAGNSTGPAVFSLMYGLPAVYWSAARHLHQGPLFITTLMQQHYQMNILASAGLKVQAFDKNIFQDVPNLTMELKGDDPGVRDEEVTRQFKLFLEQKRQPQQPFFSFLFYDASHGYCSLYHIKKPFQPAPICDRLNLSGDVDKTLLLNNYKNALASVDNQVGQVLALLKSQHLLDNTVLIIMGDHSEEFNDNHLGYWGHASNFTRYQLHTPLIMHWPHAQPKTYTHQTTHYDVVPTLMKNVLGCTSMPDSYSFGTSLFDTRRKPYLLATSYIGFGVIEEDQITTVFLSGMLEVTDLQARIKPNAALRLDTIRAATADLKRFMPSSQRRS